MGGGKKEVCPCACVRATGISEWSMHACMVKASENCAGVMQLAICMPGDDGACLSDSTAARETRSVTLEFNGCSLKQILGSAQSHAKALIIRA